MKKYEKNVKFTYVTNFKVMWYDYIKENFTIFNYYLHTTNWYNNDYNIIVTMV